MYTSHLPIHTSLFAAVRAVAARGVLGPIEAVRGYGVRRGGRALLNAQGV